MPQNAFSHQRILSLWRNARRPTQKCLHTPLREAPQKWFQPGPALAKAGPTCGPHKMPSRAVVCPPWFRGCYVGSTDHWATQRPKTLPGLVLQYCIFKAIILSQRFFVHLGFPRHPPERKKRCEKWWVIWMLALDFFKSLLRVLSKWRFTAWMSLFVWSLYARQWLFVSSSKATYSLP